MAGLEMLIAPRIMCEARIRLLCTSEKLLLWCDRARAADIRESFHRSACVQGVAEWSQTNTYKHIGERPLHFQTRKILTQQAAKRAAIAAFVIAKLPEASFAGLQNPPSDVRKQMMEQRKPP